MALFLLALTFPRSSDFKFDICGDCKRIQNNLGLNVSQYVPGLIH